MNEQQDQHDQLHDLLERVADPDGTSPAGSDVSHDLDRARTALRHRRRRTFSLAASGLAAAAVLSIGTAAIMSGAQDTAPLTSPSPSALDPSVGEVRLVAETMKAGPYTFGTTPEGWELQNNEPLAVTIGRIGDTNTDPMSFVGKVVIMLDDMPLGEGEPAVGEGREMVVRDNGDGYHTISVRTRPGEPGSTVRLQYPDGVGWTREAALTFLGSVQVGPGAQISHG